MALASQLKTGAEFFTVGLDPAMGEVGGCPHLPSPYFSFSPHVSSLFPISQGIWRTLALTAAPDGPAQSNEHLPPNPVEYAG